MSGNPTRADLWHIKVGNTSWCNYPTSIFMMLALNSNRPRRIALTCSHTSKEEAQELVDALKELKVDARVVPGGCDQNEDYRSDDDE